MGERVSKNTNYSMYGHTFLAITQPFFGESGLDFYGNSGDYYLSISYETFWLWAIIDFFGPAGS